MKHPIETQITDPEDVREDNVIDESEEMDEAEFVTDEPSHVHIQRPGSV